MWRRRRSTQLGEILEQAEPGCLALLRMELCRKQVAPADAGTEGRRIIGFSCNDSRISRDDIVGVYEIEMLAVVDTAEDCWPLPQLQLVPTHVGHLELGRNVEPHDFTGDDAEPFVLAV